MQLIEFWRTKLRILRICISQIAVMVVSKQHYYYEKTVQANSIGVFYNIKFFYIECKVGL